MSENTSPAVSSEEKKKAGSIKAQKKVNAPLILTVIECVLFGVLSIINVFAVHALSELDPYYKLYYFISILGFIGFVVIIAAYFKKWLGIQLLSVIAVLIWTTYCAATILSCVMTTKVIKMEKPFRESEMYVVFNGTLYQWEGETVIYGLPTEWEDYDLRATTKTRDDSKIPTEELHTKGIPEGSMIYYQNGYKYILVEVCTGSLFEFIDPNDPPTEPISKKTQSAGFGI